MSSVPGPEDHDRHPAEIGWPSIAAALPSSAAGLAAALTFVIAQSDAARTASAAAAGYLVKHSTAGS